jgi:pimeloyl-ACP methyl ester carboxylesterase
MNRNWELTAPWAGAMITAPALYVTGTYDAVRTFGDQYAIERVPEMLTDLRGLLDFEDCGHWTQQERPDKTNKALVEFLTGF